jgi:hypothetical protein
MREEAPGDVGLTLGRAGEKAKGEEAWEEKEKEKDKDFLSFPAPCLAR